MLCNNSFILPYYDLKMNYHFQGKYKNRKDISVLVVEKNVNPFEREDTRHDIRSIASFLKGYGFSVDLIWTLSKWKFTRFENFLGSIIGKFEDKIRDYSERKDDIGEILSEHTKRELEDFNKRDNLLRKVSISSVDDLACYDFLVMHLDFEDCEEVLPKIIEDYPNKPIILPIGSVASAGHSTSKEEFGIDDIKKDPKYNSVYLIDTNFDAERAVLTLIEYLLDEREKIRSRL